MATGIQLSDLNAFPVVRGNTRTTRSFTEQNVASLISNLFVDMSDETKSGFTVCKHGNKVLFNIAGRFFDLDISDSGITTRPLYVGILIESTSNEIQYVKYSSNGSDSDFSDYMVLQILDDSSNLVNQIHLYANESAQGNNAYQTKSQLDNTYATKTTVGEPTDEASTSGNLYQKVNAILAIDTIDGGTIS